MCIKEDSSMNYIYNTVNGDSYKILKTDNETALIDYYNQKLLITIGDIWKLVKEKENI